MASSPDSQPQSPPSPPSSLIPLLPSLVDSTPPKGSPPSPESSSPPPSVSSPPPPEAKAPPPTATSPPPAPPTSPPPSPPPSSPLSPPPSPPVASPPPQSPPSSPPPRNSPTPVFSPPPDQPSPSPPDVVLSPPPTDSPPDAPSPPVPESEPSVAPPPLTNPFIAPPPVDSTSPPVPPTSTVSPPSNSSTPSVPTQKPTSKSASHGTNVTLNTYQQSPGSPDQSARMGIAIGVVAAVLIIGFAMTILFVQRRRKRHDRYNSVYMMPSPFASSPASGSSFVKQNSNGGDADYVHSSPEQGGLGNSKVWFTYDELGKATDGFASHNILGAGGFGCVYKGFLQDGKEVAVKKLKDNSGQGDREFKAEVEIISRVHHRHLVTLVGYCITEYQRLLVYEFVPNDTLHYHLHASNKPVMQWTLRVKVACGSARGIAYLHEDCHPRIIHRDIKSPNILIDNNFEAKVADFGLAKLAQELESQTHVSTRVMGTFGYMAPEYASSGKLTEKSDVFSFGVVLLEMITGRKPVDETRPLGDESLVEWARPLMGEALESQNFDELADPRLQGNYDRGEMFRMIEAAAACVRHSATKRPKMSQVVRALDTISELSDLSNGMKPGQSEIYDSREQSAQIRLFQRMAFGSQEFSSDYYNSSQGSWPSSAGRSTGHTGGSSGQV